MRGMKILGIIFLLKSISNAEDWYKININDVDKSNIPDVNYELEYKHYKPNIISDFFDRLDNFFGVEYKVFEDSNFHKSLQKSSNIVFRKDLNPIKDKYLYSGITFLTPKKNTVYMSLAKSENCPGANSCSLGDKFFITFVSGQITYFVRVKDVINLGIFMSGSKTVEFDGEKYTVKIKANVSDVQLSRIEVLNSENKKVVNKSLSEVRDTMSLAGYDLKLEKNYKVMYGRKVECKTKELCEFKNSNVVFIIEYPFTDESEFLTIDESVYSGRELFFENIGNSYSFYISNEVLVVRKK